MSLIVEIILLGLPSSISTPAVDKTQHFFHLSFNYTLLLINGISSDFQKLLKYFNSTASVVFLKIPLAPSDSVFFNELPLYMKNLKLFELYSIRLYIDFTKS